MATEPATTADLDRLRRTMEAHIRALAQRQDRARNAGNHVDIRLFERSVSAQAELGRKVSALDTTVKLLVDKVKALEQRVGRR